MVSVAKDGFGLKVKLPVYGMRKVIWKRVSPGRMGKRKV